MVLRISKLLFPVLAASLFASWAVAFAAGNAMPGEESLRIEPARAPATPSATVFGKAIGGVRPGDLFYIDATTHPADIQVNLYLTNGAKLIQGYRYLILKIGVYAQGNDGDWDKASGCSGEPIPDTFITIRNGQVAFCLSGSAYYKVTVDEGSFHSLDPYKHADTLSPQFYLDVN